MKGVHSLKIGPSNRSNGYVNTYRNPRRSRTVNPIFASEQAGRLLLEGKIKFNAGDRMGALLLWEKSVEQDPDPKQRQVALFNATCVHASFGDIELAQITLREAVQCGIDFKKAVETPEEIDPALVNLVASQQVLIKLRKFNEATLKAMGSAASPSLSSARSSSKFSSASGRKKPAITDDDLSNLLETDIQGIDASVFGIIRRVVLLLVALSGIGVVMFFVGIKYLFPETM